MQLAQSEHVSAVYHQSVDRRHVNARLDDGRAHQYVVAALPEIEHDPLQGTLVHLPVGDRDAGFGHQFPKPGGHFFDVTDPVVDEENLAFAQQFPADGFGHGPLVVLTDVGEDRPAGGRRRSDERQVPDAGQAHFQRSRYRRGRHGQHVHVGAQLLYRLFVGDAEALLLVHHQQTEILELDVLRQQFVGADDDVDRPRRPGRRRRLWSLPE